MRRGRITAVGTKDCLSLAYEVLSMKMTDGTPRRGHPGGMTDQPRSATKKHALEKGREGPAFNARPQGERLDRLK